MTGRRAQTDAQFPSIGSQKQGMQKNADGSVDVYFGPKAPAGKEGNWVQEGGPPPPCRARVRTSSCASTARWSPFFNKTWRPGEIELVK